MSAINNTIKLVIWDLDETFWKGTLSEGIVEPINDNILLVKQLSERGIINSICSKNDFEKAKAKLVEFGVWDYFVFPIIDWLPKGDNVRKIIERCQLRAINTLFIDDNTGNLQEVAYYNNAINTLNAAELDGVRDELVSQGKDDATLSRLAQYKVIESKFVVSNNYSDNKAFLKASNIQLTYINPATCIQRISELIARTNQLNFTKKRIGTDALVQLIDSESVEAKAIYVKDNFGDYGICGFYALNKPENRLEHFLFSCRILNMDVERFIYNKLGRPTIDIEGDVAGNLNDTSIIDYINEVDDVCSSDNRPKAAGKRKSILLLGGCDLDQMVHYLDRQQLNILKEFNYVNKAGLAVHREHTLLLRTISDGTVHEKDTICKLPFMDEDVIKSKLFDANYDTLVFSVLMDYTQDIYENNDGLRVPYGGYVDLSLKGKPLKWKQNDFDEFINNWHRTTQITPNEFKQNLQWLVDKLKKPIIFINGAEVETPSSNVYEKGAKQRHSVMNAALEEFVATHPSCRILDMRSIIHSTDDVTDNIRHYQRKKYVEMAQALSIMLLGNNATITRESFFNLVRYALKELKKKIKLAIAKVKNMVEA